MPVTSISWGKSAHPANFLTIGEFVQGPNYRTIRKSGTPNRLFILTLEGSGRVFSVDRDSIDTQPGDILLFEPGAYHNYGTASGADGWELIWSHFVPPDDWDYWESWPFRWSGLRTGKVGPITSARICDALRIVHAVEFTRRDTIGAFMLNCLQRAWLHIRQSEERERSPNRDARIQKALHFMETRLSQSLSVEAISKHCGLSLSRFAHLFKDEVKRTPQQYLESRRMEQARNLLLYSNLTITEISQACGYEDAFYFSTRFKRAFGQSPRAFRGG